MKAQAEFDEDDETDADWQLQLELEKNGKIKDTLDNIVLILDNAPQVAAVGYNELKSNLDFIAMPAWNPIKYPAWTDNDTLQLRVYLSEVYGLYSPNKTRDALNMVAAKRKHHPIREYLNALPPWDGKVRVETLLIDHLGAEDTPYTRAVTRKTLVAAVARVFVPGIKFDSVLVMNGPQGVGKSTLILKLGGDWYSDSLSISYMKDKTAPEKLQGYWILEIGELAGIKKMDVETVKSFITRTDDKYRPRYGKTVESHPRQCIIIGTVNGERGYLRDITGNRRFWIVKVHQEEQVKKWEFTPEERDQIWAEAKAVWAGGEKLYLEGEMIKSAEVAQREAMEVDERQGMIEEYLDTLLPANWDTMNFYERRDYIRDPDDPTHSAGTVRRVIVSNMEVWCECFGKPKEDIKPADSYAIAAIMERIEGWEKSGNKTRLGLYGEQRYYTRDK